MKKNLSDEDKSYCARDALAGFVILEKCLAKEDIIAAEREFGGEVESESKSESKEEEDERRSALEEEEELNGELRAAHADMSLPMTRHLLDPIHAIWRVTKLVKKSHKYYNLLSALLSRTIFDFDAEDIEKCEIVFKRDYGTTFAKEIMKRRKFVLKFVKRYVAPPEELVPKLQELLNTLKNDCFKDPSFDNAPLLDEAAIKAFENLINNHAAKGCMSDITGRNYYTEKRIHKNGLTEYWCSRGTITN